MDTRRFGMGGGAGGGQGYSAQTPWAFWPVSRPSSGPPQAAKASDPRIRAAAVEIEFVCLFICNSLPGGEAACVPKLRTAREGICHCVIGAASRRIDGRAS